MPARRDAVVICSAVSDWVCSGSELVIRLLGQRTDPSHGAGKKRREETRLRSVKWARPLVWRSYQVSTRGQGQLTVLPTLTLLCSNRWGFPLFSPGSSRDNIFKYVNRFLLNPYLFTTHDQLLIPSTQYNFLCTVADSRDRFLRFSSLPPGLKIGLFVPHLSEFITPNQPANRRCMTCIF
jgi:hypothetical protein